MLNSTIYKYSLWISQQRALVCATANLIEIVSVLKPVCIVLFMIILKFVLSSDMHNVSSDLVNLLKATKGAKSSIFQAYIWEISVGNFLYMPNPGFQTGTRKSMWDANPKTAQPDLHGSMFTLLRLLHPYKTQCTREASTLWSPNSIAHHAGDGKATIHKFRCFNIETDTYFTIFRRSSLHNRGHKFRCLHENFSSPRCELNFGSEDQFTWRTREQTQAETDSTISAQRNKQSQSTFLSCFYHQSCMHQWKWNRLLSRRGLEWWGSFCIIWSQATEF